MLQFICILFSFWSSKVPKHRLDGTKSTPALSNESKNQRLLTEDKGCTRTRSGLPLIRCFDPFFRSQSHYGRPPKVPARRLCSATAPRTSPIGAAVYLPHRSYLLNSPTRLLGDRFELGCSRCEEVVGGKCAVLGCVSGDSCLLYL